MTASGSRQMAHAASRVRQWSPARRRLVLQCKTQPQSMQVGVFGKGST